MVRRCVRDTEAHDLHIYGSLRPRGTARGDPDRVPFSPAGTSRPDTDLVHLEPDAAQTLGEGPIGTGRPYGQHAPGPKCRKGGIQPGPCVEPVVALPGQTLGAVVHVQQDGVVGPVLHLENLGDVDLANSDPAS